MGQSHEQSQNGRSAVLMLSAITLYKHRTILGILILGTPSWRTIRYYYMNMRKLNKKAVLSAIAEYDRIGQDAFLNKYGFGKARTYVLTYKRKFYDSKAIVGAAYRHQYGTALKPSDFSGGKATVVRILHDLDFKVVDRTLDKQSVAFPEESSGQVWEGASQLITATAYERNRKAREACIKEYGSVCKICGFDFGIEFGPDFEGFIHVHHLVPLSKITKQYKVNPKKDLIPVCPNCHAALHYGGKDRTPDQVRNLRNKLRVNKKAMNTPRE